MQPDRTSPHGLAFGKSMAPGVTVWDWLTQHDLAFGVSMPRGLEGASIVSDSRPEVDPVCVGEGLLVLLWPAYICECFGEFVEVFG